jgi:hypothetical protein
VPRVLIQIVVLSIESLVVLECLKISLLYNAKVLGTRFVGMLKACYILGRYRSIFLMASLFLRIRRLLAFSGQLGIFLSWLVSPRLWSKVPTG